MPTPVTQDNRKFGDGQPVDPRNFVLDGQLLRKQLQSTPLEPARDALIQAVNDSAHLLRHGDMPIWRAALNALPRLEPCTAYIDQDVITVDAPRPENTTQLEDSLRILQPWRKGPFTIAGVHIDTEWRSDWKWNRLIPHIEPLHDRTVLDVGCGSGYHLWRMRGAGAKCVLGIDPGLLFLAQFQAVQHFINDPAVQLLPLTLTALPPQLAVFDTVFSMGVLYHRQDPHLHLQELLQALRPAGELVLETLVIPAEDDSELEIQGRYARMRNLWMLPSPARVSRWLAVAGFTNIRVVSVNMTTTSEQRSTRWMTKHSLKEALHPKNPDLTIEGHPRPHRAILLANRPG